MIHPIIRYGFAFFTVLLALNGHGQTIPLGALPMQFNPAFAGEAGSPRFSSNFGLRTAGTDRSNSYAFNTSYDQFIPAIRSGVGFSAGYTNFSSRFYSGTGYSFALAVAPKFSVKGKYTISPSLDLSYGRGVNHFENWFGTNEPQQVKYYGFQSRVGLLFNTTKWYIGYAIDIPLSSTHQYNPPFASPSGRAGRFNSYWQFGYTFQRSSESRFSFTPQLVFRTGSEPYEGFRYFTPVVFNLNFRYQKFIWGINNTGVHLGWQTDKVRVMLSNGFSSEGRGGNGYTGNATFRYMLKQSRW